MRLGRKSIYEINIWPGFVDILGTLLIVTIFTVLISTITQIYFNDQLDIKRGEISELDKKIGGLLSQIKLINEDKKQINIELSKLKKSYNFLNKEKIRIDEQYKSTKEELSKSKYLFKMKNQELNEIVEQKGNLIDKLQSKNEKILILTEEEEKKSLEIFELKRNIEKLNNRLSELSKLLIASEETDKENQIKIENLGKRLNQALAGKVQELTEYQSIFFRKIKEALGEREDIIVSGDRFIFPSEIFFQSGSDVIQEEGIEKLLNISMSLKDISKKIPSKIDWVLRIDGHTDKIPINNEEFKSNWHLSSSRAINIVKFFIESGIPPKRLVAAGFGEHSPLTIEETEKALRENRRIEIKLTTR